VPIAIHPPDHLPPFTDHFVDNITPQPTLKTAAEKVPQRQDTRLLPVHTDDYIPSLYRTVCPSPCFYLDASTIEFDLHSHLLLPILLPLRPHMSLLSYLHTFALGRHLRSTPMPAGLLPAVSSPLLIFCLIPLALITTYSSDLVGTQTVLASRDVSIPS
jgi:hypothetical protein